MKFSVVYKPMTLFSLRDSNSTSSGAKSLLLPSPYAIKMAFISQAISLGGVDFNDAEIFKIIRDAKISYYIDGNMCVNNCFVKIQKQRDKEPFKPTISFREYVFMDGELEIIFEVPEQADVDFLKKYLYRINYFGKRGCFYQFIKYNDLPHHTANVREWNSRLNGIIQEYDDSSQNALDCKLFPNGGVIQEYDDFSSALKFENVNSYNGAKTKREKRLFVLPLRIASSSKSYTKYLNVKCR